MRKKRAPDVLTLLRQEAGVSIARNGGYGTTSSVFMRGANSNQVLILIDGVPIRDTSSTGSPVALEHLLPDQIERIEVVRGNVSAVYGSGAIGGVIQIFTKRGEGPPSVSLTAEAGTDSTTRLSAGIFGKQEEIRYNLGVTRYKTEGYSSMNTHQYPNANPDDDGTRNISVNAGISREWGPGNEFGARLYAYDAKYQYDGSSTKRDQWDHGTSKEWTAAAFSKNRFTSNWDSTVTLSQTEIERWIYSKNGASGDYTGKFKSQASMAQWNNQIALSSDWVATVGTDIAREKAQTGAPKTFSRTNHSVYAGVNGDMGNHHLQLNARYDHVEESGSDVTGYLGYGYDLTSSWKLVASVSTAFLAPTLYQVYDPYSGSKDLEAERSRSYEAGIQYASGKTLVRATFFDTHTRDMIDWVSTGGWSGQYFNVGRTKNKGFELNGTTQLAGIDIRGNLTIQDPKNRDTDKQLNRRAKKLASLDVSKTLGAWYLGGDVHYEEHRPDIGDKRLPSYAIFNLNARYQINKEVSVFARIENLFDRDYQTAYGYDMPDRGFFAGVNWKM
ncbi:TonB-dependent receptor [Oxalobacter vibrioformis]|uniref:TonB-dependent receptor n=1 Tax=Oxalobacter vibrioformis TaxID=933080 RepID=A0A9E9LVX5_9BURK|nr:TonB-dependent receptor [Oxalobacter vibrioformis]WAW10715.1 TonB-dependent receptor [Oxalobacter vibrioformis]